MSQNPFYILRKSRDGQYYFVLEAPNDEVIATSEMYTTKQAAKNGIESVKRNAPVALTIDMAD